MSAPTLSVAVTAGASASLCNNKLSSPFSLLHYHTTQFQSKPKWNPKPLRLKTQNPNSLLFSLDFSSSCLPFFSSSFDSIQLAEDAEGTEVEEYPDSEGFEESEQEEEEEQKAPLSGRKKRRLFVGGLPYSMTSSELAEIFGEAGRVVFAEIVCDHITGGSRGFGFVTMGSVEEAQKAILLFDGSQIGERTVKVNFPEVPKGGERKVTGAKIQRVNKSFIDSPFKIYVGNLDWSVTSEGLRNAFANQQGLLSAKVIYDRDTGRSRRFGFVSFETAEDVQAAITALKGVELEGRPLRLDVAAAERATRTPPPEVGEKKIENSL